jgi:hypothetical protein
MTRDDRRITQGNRLNELGRGPASTHPRTDHAVLPLGSPQVLVEDAEEHHRVHVDRRRRVGRRDIQKERVHAARALQCCERRHAASNSCSAESRPT